MHGLLAGLYLTCAILRFSLLCLTCAILRFSFSLLLFVREPLTLTVVLCAPQDGACQHGQCAPQNKRRW